MGTDDRDMAIRVAGYVLSRGPIMVYEVLDHGVRPEIWRRDAADSAEKGGTA